jgi:ADP-ribose pyrophosphatase
MELVYDGWLKLYKMHFEGKTYEILDNHDAVAAIVLDGEGKLLLVEQFRPALGVNTLELPAGVVDKAGLNLQEIMAEELFEEAALEIDPAALESIIVFKPIVGFSKSQMTVYYTTVKKVYSGYDVTDCDVFRVHWITFETFENWVKSGLVFDNKTVMAYYYLKAQQMLGDKS